MRIAALMVIFLLLSPLIPGSQGAGSQIFGWVIVPAVDSGGSGSLLNVTVLVKYPGSGRVVVRTEAGEAAVDELTRASMTMAFMTGSLLAGYYWGLFDALITIKTRERISGPSGGFAVALLTYSLLISMKNFSLGSYAVTGAISPDGLSSRVGGVDAKCRAAQGGGLYLMLPVSNVQDLSRACAVSRPVTGVLEAFEVTTGTSTLAGNVSFKMPEGFNAAMRRAALELINLTESLRGSLNPQARQQLARAREQLNRSPYSAASLAFGAYATALRAYYEQAVQSGGVGWVREEMGRIRAEQQRLRAQLDAKGKEGSIYYVEFLATAYTRLADSNSSLRAAESALNRGLLSEAIEYLSFARARVETVKAWIRTAEAVKESRPRVSEEEVKAAAFIFGSYVEAATSYAIRYVEHAIRYYPPPDPEGRRVRAQLVDELRRQGRAEREAGNYVASLGFYREAFSRSLSELFIPPNIMDKAMADRYRRELGQTLFLLSSYAYSKGLASGLSPAYLEYSKVRYDYGDYDASVALLQEAVASTVLWSSLAVSRAVLPPGGVTVRVEEGRSPTAAPSLNPWLAVLAFTLLVAAFTFGMIFALQITLRVAWRSPTGNSSYGSQVLLEESPHALTPQGGRGVVCKGHAQAPPR